MNKVTRGWRAPGAKIWIGDDYGMNVNENIGVSGHWLFTWQDQAGNATIREVKNIVVQSGLEALAALVVGEIPQENAIFLALGTGTTVADHADTILEEEGYRKIIASRSRFSSEIRFRFFFTVSEGNGDWSEAGVFLAGTEMPDTGHLLNRVLPPGGVSKADNQTLTVEVRISLYAA